MQIKSKLIFLINLNTLKINLIKHLFSGRIDVYPTFFTAGNVNMSDQSTFELSLYVQVDAENWKYERTHSEAFSYTLGVKCK